MHFGERLTQRVRALRSATCIGLDPHLDRLPPSVLRGGDRAALASGAAAFCRGVIEVTADLIPACKPQAAFFEALGAPGAAALEEVVGAARDAGMLVILDAKRGDIGSTAEAYARATLDPDGPLGADAVTLSPYLGPESLEPFLHRCAEGKGLFVLVRTSNPGAGAWQARIAPAVADWVEQANAPFGDLGPIGAVVGATLGGEAADWRARMPHAWFLVPGFGAQGAGHREIRQHVRPDGLGSLVVSARAVLFPPSGVDGPRWKDAVRARAERFVEEVGRALPIG